MTMERPLANTTRCVVIDLAACAVERMTNHLLAGRRNKAEIVLHAFWLNYHQEGEVVSDSLNKVYTNVTLAAGHAGEVGRRLLPAFQKTATHYAD